VTVDFQGARGVIEASRCALDRQYATRDHVKCDWCQHPPVDLLRAVHAWMKDTGNSADIAKEDRGEEQLW